VQDQEPEHPGTPTLFRPGEEHPEAKPISGSTSIDFATVLANQVMGAPIADDPAGRERQARAAAAAMQGIAPRDAIEGILAAQIVATHNAGMECLRKGNKSAPLNQYVAHYNIGNKLLRTCALLVEALDRRRGRGKQEIRVERVNVAAGGQAVVGVINQAERRPNEARNEAAEPRLIADRAEEPMRRADPRREPVPVLADHGQDAL
jgi:hypothetical protein